MLSVAQIDARRTGIGGSDAAAAVGISPWKTPYQLWCEKRGEGPVFEGNALTDWGNRLEPAIRQKYADDTGRIVRLPTETLRHPSIPFLLCHPDGVTEDGRLFEAKNTRVGERWTETDVPEEHLIQVQHNMLVMGLEVADLAVLIAGSDFRIYEIRADLDLHRLLIERESEFWSRVERGDAPPITTPADVKLRFGRLSLAAKVEADAYALAACVRLNHLKADAKKIAEGIEAEETAVKLALGDKDTLSYGEKILATWKLDKPSEKFDAAAFKAAHPDLHAQFCAPAPPVRRFLLKGQS